MVGQTGCYGLDTFTDQWDNLDGSCRDVHIIIYGEGTYAV